MTRSIRVLTICAAFLALPAAAQAAAPFTAGSGSDPTVAVGSDGSGHVAWETGIANVKVGYCRVSPGAEACNHTELLEFPGSEPQSAGRAQVFAPAPEKVVIVAGCYTEAENQVYRWISTDNGGSFGPREEIGHGAGNNGFGAWLDGSEIFVGANFSRVKAQSAPPPGTEGEGVEFASTITSYWPEVAQVPGEEKLVAATNDLEKVEYGVYEGPLSVGEINTQAKWSNDLPLSSPEGGNSETALDSGPSGLYLSYLHFIPNDNQVGLRRFDPATNSFGAPVYVQGSDPIDKDSVGAPDSYQDSSGRIHVLWTSNYEGGRLRYTVSDTSGGNFSTPETLAANEGFYQPEIAAGADGHGFAVWTPNVAGSIRVVPLDPYPESAPSSTAPAPTPPVAVPPTVTKARIGNRILVPGQKTVFRFRSSSAGHAVLTFEKRFKGIKGRRRIKKGANRGRLRTVCLPLNGKRLRALRRRARSPRALRRLLKKRGCHGFRRIGRIRQRVVKGANTIRFNGRLAGRKLSPGRYRALLVVTDAAGAVSRTETLRFKVVRKTGRKRGRRHRRRP